MSKLRPGKPGRAAGRDMTCQGAREREEFKSHGSTTRFLGEVSEVDQSSHVAGSTLGMISVKLMVPITSIAVATTNAQ